MNLKEINPYITSEAEKVFKGWETSDRTESGPMGLAQSSYHDDKGTIFSIYLGFRGIDFADKEKMEGLRNIGVLEINTNSPIENGPQLRLLEMNVLFDEKHDLVGLKGGGFTAWYHDFDSNRAYQLGYKVDNQKPDEAELVSILAYDKKRGEKIEYKNLTSSKELPIFLPISYPRRVDWLTTFGNYVFGINFAADKRPIEISDFKYRLLAPGYMTKSRPSSIQIAD
ncbi:MAG: hypothetical protein M1366_05565 [Patescibacteria group bacterium]|nr:hypothetical protein [Patescibacteria group bacterium]